MKKLNNKGFAISTMLYGLLILIVLIILMIISIMAFNRKNSREFSEQIVNDLENIKSYNSNILAAYTYNSSTCVTGEESTCVSTECYKSTTVGSCPAGTIIKYKVNDTDIVTFHVMYDNGTTMTMQSQKNIIDDIMWISEEDYKIENTDGTSCPYSSCIDEGPMTSLVSLEQATKSWTNVNDQTYTMGTTVFKTNRFTDCWGSSYCTTNIYKLDERTAKARMITVQETADLGCTTSYKSCPNWLNNYLYDSTSYGGTVNDNSTFGYWTMNTFSSYTPTYAWLVEYNGDVHYGYLSMSLTGVRAVIVISK